MRENEPVQPLDDQSPCLRQLPNENKNWRPRNENESQETMSVEKGSDEQLLLLKKKKRDARTSREGLDMDVISYRVMRDGWKQKGKRRT